MARNEEKQMGRLNRLILQQEKAEFLKKNPRRPRLNTVNTPDEIKQWLPSIKADMDFCLKQSMVTCYSETKVQEYRDEVLRLEREYKSFVQKLRRLDPEMSSVPWTSRPYERKKPRNLTENQPEISADHIPILELPHCVPKVTVPSPKLEDSNLLLEDQPLRFSEEFEKRVTEMRESNRNRVVSMGPYEPIMGFEEKLRTIYGMAIAPDTKDQSGTLGIDYSSGDENT